jgi:hypothetical protein
MNIQTWLLRASRWARNPPSEGRVRLVFGVIALCLLIVAFEWAFGWPDWLTVNRISAKP